MSDIRIIRMTLVCPGDRSVGIPSGGFEIQGDWLIDSEQINDFVQDVMKLYTTWMDDLGGRLYIETKDGPYAYYEVNRSLFIEEDGCFECGKKRCKCI